MFPTSFVSFLFDSLNVLLHFRIQYHLYNKVHIKFLLRLDIFIVFICEVFRMTPTLFDESIPGIRFIEF